jgi:benzoylformate decarboxylase
MATTTVRRALVDALAAQGVQWIAGNPGSTEVPLLDSLAATSDVRYILTLHESVAMALADGYAQLARRPGLVSVHATPGLANVLGGLFMARAHRSPIVVLAGQQDSRLLGRRPFLASDLAGLAGYHAKMAVQAGRPEDVVPTVLRAIRVALEPPAGPAVVAIPRDFQDAEVEVDPGVRAAAGAVGAAAVAGRGRRPPVADIAAVARVIAAARRPVIFSGNGVGAAGEEAVRQVVALAELVGAPVHSEHNATNMHFPTAHPQYLGGNAHGTAAIRPWLADADLLIAIGCDLFMEDRYVEEPILPSTCRIVQLDEDPLEIGRLLPVEAGAAGDLVVALGDLLRALEERYGPAEHAAAERHRSDVHVARADLNEARARELASVREAHPIRMPRLYAELRAALPDDAIMVDEAINMASYLHAFFDFRTADTLLSSKQGWLGWGWGAALGAQLAHPERRVVAVLGDGSASYAVQALWTAAQGRLPIVSVILDNGGYVAVQNHLRNYGGQAVAAATYPGSLLGGIDFVALAAGYGVPGRLVDGPAEIGEGLRWALGVDGPSLVQVRIDPDDAGMGRAPIPRRPVARRSRPTEPA